jgi:tetratricopeptide (TPR) repeat protein
MAEYCMHAGRFADAGLLLKEAKDIHPYRQDSITGLNGRLQLLTGKPLLAIAYYKEYLVNNPNDVNVMYSIAKMYALAKNNNEAWKWLTQAINKGFNYYWVLKFDESWNILRSSAKWKELTAAIKPTG